MEEQAIVAARASVMVYDDENKKWVHSGTSTGVSKVHIYQHMTHSTFRVVGRKLHDHELVINCSIIKGLKYNKATPTFHQWRDTKQVYGLNFSTKEDAENFANSMLKVLEILNQSHNQLMMNGNTTVAINNSQLNQNIINPINQQQNQQQPVYAHLNETQQIIKQQYQAPPEYSEVIQANNRTNGWANQQVLSQPNSLDLNDWRQQQQLQHDLNQLNLNSLNGQQVQIINHQMQPIYGHRNSLPNQTTNAQQIQQNAQLIQHQQQLIHQQTNHQISNSLTQQQQQQQQTNTLQQQNQLNQQQTIQSPPQVITQQAIISQPSNLQNLNNQTNQAPTNGTTQSNNIINNNNIQSQPPSSNIPVPPPPPPMPPLSNLTAPKPPPIPSTNSSNLSTSNQQSSSSLASALANAKLKKTPNKDDLIKEKSAPNLGGGMASMMDEMAKTLARRRAQAEGGNTSHTNGNCNSSEEIDSASNRIKNGWDKNNRTSPNKDNDLHSRTKSVPDFDVEKFKQEIMIEMKKELKKTKLEIIEVIKSELSRNY